MKEGAPTTTTTTTATATTTIAKKLVLNAIQWVCNSHLK
jgi:hypothetical protein